MENDTRKGFLTPEQEKTLIGLLKPGNKVMQAVEGVAVSLVDNQALERLKSKLETLHPGTVEIVYEVIDTLFDALEKAKEPEVPGSPNS